MNNADYSFNKNREIEIDLVDVFWKLLIQWKAVLIICLFTSLLVPSIKLMKDTRDYKIAIENHKHLVENASLPSADRIKAVLDPLSKEDRDAVLSVLNQKELFEQELDYLNNSILLSNPSNQRQLVTYYLLSQSESVNMQTLADTYTSCLHHPDNVAALKKAIAPNASDDCISELIITSPDEKSTVDSTANNAVFSVTVILPEEADKATVSDIIATIMADANKEVCDIVGVHRLQLINVIDTHVYSKDLALEKREIAESIKDLNSSVKSAESTLSEEQRAVYDKIRTIVISGSSDIAGEASSSNVIPKSPRINIKFAIVGFLLGGFIYTLIYIVFLMLNNNIASATTAQSYIGTRLLGEIYLTKEHKGFSRLLTSKRVVKWRYKEKLDIEAQMSSAIETIGVVCCHHNVKKLTFLKSGVSFSSSNLLDNIIAKCKSELNDIDLIVIDTDKMDEKELLTVKDTVFVVANTSRPDNLDALLGLCNYYDLTKHGVLYTEEL